MELDVYDFDGTIYDGDSTVDFVLFCLRRHPRLSLDLARCIPTVAQISLRRVNLTQFKSILFRAMAKVIDLNEEATRFWADERTRSKLGAWFFKTPRDLPIVIASASPEFELRHAMPFLGAFALIGTRCEANGQLIGENCKGEEKIRRLHALYGNFSVRAMYTDSPKSDAPLLAVARERFLVTHGSVKRI